MNIWEEYETIKLEEKGYETLLHGKGAPDILAIKRDKNNKIIDVCFHEVKFNKDKLKNEQRIWFDVLDFLCVKNDVIYYSDMSLPKINILNEANYDNKIRLLKKRIRLIKHEIYIRNNLIHYLSGKKCPENKIVKDYNLARVINEKRKLEKHLYRSLIILKTYNSKAFKGLKPHNPTIIKGCEYENKGFRQH